jgi:hypothetical protein
MRHLAIWIPGAPKGPNQRASTTRGRMRNTRAEREKAQMCAIKARVHAEVRQPGVRLVFKGPTRITWELRRVRLLDDDNAIASLKHYRDGITKAVLPLGDGPGTPYLWGGMVQIRVGEKSEEGAFVEIEELATDGAPSGS